MAKKDDVIEVEATVLETLPNAMFKVCLLYTSYVVKECMNF